MYSGLNIFPEGESYLYKKTFLDTAAKNKHLLWRAGFGPNARQLSILDNTTPAALLTELLNSSSQSPHLIDITDPEIRALSRRVDDQGKPIVLTAAQRLRIREASREDYKKLNVAWLQQMVESENQLGEKMALFWHGHFASRSINIFYQQQLIDILRTHAMGNFGTLLKEVSRSASMINFLNNNQNRKDRPNENFAREVMELFTLGIGNYTEKDVKEAARAFTGWGVTVQGDFSFRRARHDEGIKTFLGKTGAFGGSDILDILLEQRATATFITRKIYRFMVNEKPDDEKVRWLSDRFYSGGYNIRNLMLDIFSSDWFFDAENTGNRIKSPVELLVGIRRTLPMEIQNAQVQVILQSLLGQVLLFPPNVAGWPGGKNWIDGSSLMLRLRIPQMIAAGEIPDLETSDNDDLAMGRMDMPKNLRGMAAVTSDIDWKPLQHYLKDTPDKDIADVLSNAVLPYIPGRKFKVQYGRLNRGSREELIRSSAIQLMSTPEYQLC